jgi:catechol 2,3-dioxygenase-like lactoylglutathione lyase family enzyme
MLPPRPKETDMTARLEHANLVVRDLDGAIRFLRTAFPEFRVRAEGVWDAPLRWAHVGSDDAYVALVEARDKSGHAAPYTGRPGLNHLGFEVDDAEALRDRMRAAGYEDSTIPNRHPARTRVYFHDAEGNDWEFVQYHSDDPAERNDYVRPDWSAS